MRRGGFLDTILVLGGLKWIFCGVIVHLSLEPDLTPPDHQISRSVAAQVGGSVSPRAAGNYNCDTTRASQRLTLHMKGQSPLWHRSGEDTP